MNDDNWVSVVVLAATFVLTVLIVAMTTYSIIMGSKFVDSGYTQKSLPGVQGSNWVKE